MKNEKKKFEHKIWTLLLHKLYCDWAAGKAEEACIAIQTNCIVTRGAGAGQGAGLGAGRSRRARRGRWALGGRALGVRACWACWARAAGGRERAWLAERSERARQAAGSRRRARGACGRASARGRAQQAWARGALGVGARGAGRGRTRRAAWALGARPRRLGWPGLCTRCTRLDFQTGFRLGIFPESINEHCSL